MLLGLGSCFVMLSLVLEPYLHRSRGHPKLLCEIKPALCIGEGVPLIKKPQDSDLSRASTLPLSLDLGLKLCWRGERMRSGFGN